MPSLRKTIAVTEIKIIRKKTTIVSIIAITVIGIISHYLLAHPVTLGNISYNCSEKTTANSNVTFLGEAGDRVKFSFRSDIENGVLNIILYDSRDNEVYRLDKAKELETFYSLINTDTYTLTAEYTDFIGQFSINIYKIK